MKILVNDFRTYMTTMKTDQHPAIGSQQVSKPPGNEGVNSRNIFGSVIY